MFPRTDKLQWNRLQTIPSQFVSAHHVSIQKYIINVFLFVFCATAPQRARASLFTRFQDHTQRRITVGRTPLDEWSARRRDLYMTTHNTHKRQISMPPVGFEPTISEGERPQAYTLDRAANGTGYGKFVIKWINPLNAKLNSICHLLALLGAHHILHVSRIRVNKTVLPSL